MKRNIILTLLLMTSTCSYSYAQEKSEISGRTYYTWRMSTDSVGKKLDSIYAVGTTSPKNTLTVPYNSGKILQIESICGSNGTKPGVKRTLEIWCQTGITCSDKNGFPIVHGTCQKKDGIVEISLYATNNTPTSKDDVIATYKKVRKVIQ